jgi:hypothetical protein
MLAGLQSLSELEKTPNEIKAESVLLRLQALNSKVGWSQRGRPRAGTGVDRRQRPPRPAARGALQLR